MVSGPRELPRRWIIHGLLPRGLTLLSAPGELDLLRVAFHLAAAVADGERFLAGTGDMPGYPVERGAVLYLALHPAPIPRHFETLMPGRRLEEILTVREWSPFGEVEALETLLSETVETRLVILDPLIRAGRRPAGMLDYHNLPYRTLERLRRLAIRDQFALVLYHHVPGRLRQEDDTPMRPLARTSGPVDCVAWFHGDPAEDACLSLAHRGQPPVFLPITGVNGVTWTIPAARAAGELENTRRW